MSDKPKARRGFAAMDPEKQRLIAQKGGRAAHAKGKAHEFTTEEARAAGRKGGATTKDRGTGHRFTTALAREAGRKGGTAPRHPVSAVVGTAVALDAHTQQVGPSPAP
jgi:general stress protein YciG